MARRRRRCWPGSSTALRGLVAERSIPVVDQHLEAASDVERVVGCEARQEIGASVMVDVERGKADQNPRGSERLRLRWKARRGSFMEVAGSVVEEHRRIRVGAVCPEHEIG